MSDKIEIRVDVQIPIRIHIPGPISRDAHAYMKNLVSAIESTFAPMVRDAIFHEFEQHLAFDDNLLILRTEQSVQDY